MHENHIVVLHIIRTGMVFQLLGMTMCSVFTLRCRLGYIILFKLPIILSGNFSFIDLLFPKLFPNISWSTSWDCKSLMDILLQLKIYTTTCKLKIVPKD